MKALNSLFLLLLLSNLSFDISEFSKRILKPLSFLFVERSGETSNVCFLWPTDHRWISFKNFSTMLRFRVPAVLISNKQMPLMAFGNWLENILFLTRTPVLYKSYFYKFAYVYSLYLLVNQENLSHKIVSWSSTFHYWSLTGSWLKVVVTISYIDLQIEC